MTCLYFSEVRLLRCDSLEVLQLRNGAQEIVPALFGAKIRSERLAQHHPPASAA